MAHLENNLRFGSFAVPFKYKGLVWDLVKRDLKIRYQGSFIGKYWNVVHPLAMIAIYTLVFSQVMNAKMGGGLESNPFGYTIYLCAGLIPWIFFSDAVTRGTDAFVENAHLIKKVSFPLELMPVVTIGSGFVTFMISMLLYGGLLVVTGVPLTPALLAVPFAMALFALFALGLAMFFGAVNVFFRDTKQIVSIVFQVWFWLTPVVYFVSAVPERWKWLFALNPAYYFISIFHALFVDGALPPPATIQIALALTIASFVCGTLMLARCKNDIPDEI